MNVRTRIGKIAGFKNVLIGFLLGLCVVLAAGVIDPYDSSIHETGRYRCCAAGSDNEAVFVIDSRTGHTWRISRTDFYDFGTPDKPVSERTSQIPLEK